MTDGDTIKKGVARPVSDATILDLVAVLGGSGSISPNTRRWRRS
ncbi:hypothetical protein M6B38_125575 [Iris pallida]|uniref:Uncharacterized protein n=1 Tax=Iris pallida TaxID=29817 RepID=A0AAX6EHP0_IRIPA|nr:hypothetical protein M6B38_188270 [Iris pallida]KAJ6830113.1 hypothetical protein M6B38_125575 [Iris pallida]